MEHRKASRSLELLWAPSGSLPEADIFTGNFASGNYGPPEGFWWDWNGGDAPMMDDPALEGYNVEERWALLRQAGKIADRAFSRGRGVSQAAHGPGCRAPRPCHDAARRMRPVSPLHRRVDTFVARCLELANVTRGNDIMLTFGSDFWYSNALAV
jgi:hypothetical protein